MLLVNHVIDATQIFGGRALTVTGMGKFIENVSQVALGAIFYMYIPLNLLTSFLFVIFAVYSITEHPASMRVSCSLWIPREDFVTDRSSFSLQ